MRGIGKICASAAGIRSENAKREIREGARKYLVVRGGIISAGVADILEIMALGGRMLAKEILDGLGTLREFHDDHDMMGVEQLLKRCCIGIAWQDDEALLLTDERQIGHGGCSDKGWYSRDLLHRNTIGLELTQYVMNRSVDTDIALDGNDHTATGTLQLDSLAAYLFIDLPGCVAILAHGQRIEAHVLLCHPLADDAAGTRRHLPVSSSRSRNHHYVGLAEQSHSLERQQLRVAGPNERNVTATALQFIRNI